MSNNRPHIKNLKSNSLLNGEARKPEPNDLEFGEIAINYATDKETIFIKNNSNEIVEFKSSSQTESELEQIRETISDDELVISSALNDLNDRILDEKSTRETADNDLGSQISQLSSQIPIPDGTTIITDNEGKLSVNTHNGLTVSSNGISVNSDTTKALDFDSNGTLGVRISDGIEFKEYDNNKKGISVKPKTNGGISVDSNGVSINTGDGITVDGTTGKLKVITGNTIEISTGGSIAVKQGNGVYTDGNGLAVKATSNGGLTVDSNGVSVNCGNGLATENGELVVKTQSNSGLTVDSNGLYLKTASTSEIGGVAIHDVHKTLIYEYHPIIGYTDDDVVVISVEEYNALPQEEKDLYWEVYGDWVEITEEQYNELPEEDKRNPAKVRITTDELTFNDGDGNFGVNINDVDNKAYVNVPIAGENDSKYGLVKVGVTKDLYDVVHGLNGIKIDRNNGKLAVDYDDNYFELNSGGVSLTLKSSVVAQLKTYYDVILYMKVLSVDVSTGDITFDNTTLNFVTYNPNDYTVSQIIAGLVNGTITTKVIVDFSAVNSNMVAKFPKIWETTMNYTGMGDIFGIYNTIFPYLDNSLTPSTSPYIKLENVGVDAQGRFQASTKVLMNHTGWTV